MDTYNSFANLAKHAEEGRDFKVRTQERLGTTVIIAPHGGGIEPGTSEIAEAIAGNDLSLYLFEGIRDENNRELHITSTRFDEPLWGGAPAGGNAHDRLDHRSALELVGGVMVGGVMVLVFCGACLTGMGECC